MTLYELEDTSLEMCFTRVEIFALMGVEWRQSPGHLCFHYNLLAEPLSFVKGEILGWFEDFHKQGSFVLSLVQLIGCNPEKEGQKI